MPFSLLMPSFNQASFIGEAVTSVLAQDDPDWDLWILDNSTDATPGIMAGFTDPRIHYVHQATRMDPGSCLNWMLERAQGDCFSYIHTDNRLLPGYVRRHRAALATHPLALAVCDYWEITEAGQRRKRRRRQDPFPLERLFSVDSIGVPFAATRELARRLGGFTCSDLADDVLFVLRADALGPRVHVPGPQMEYRVHGASRFLAHGLGPVQRAIHGSVLAASRERPSGLPDPFAGGDRRALRHVARAARMALLRCTRQLRGARPGPVWIAGTGPESFWAAWACWRLGWTVEGFLDQPEGELLGLPVVGAAPGAGAVLEPLWGRGVGESLVWALHGLPLLDHPLKALPGPVMSGLLVPYQLAEPDPGPLFLRAEGAMGAYLAYGAERLGGLRVAGLIGERLSWPPLEGRMPGPEATIWAAPGAGPGPGRPWRPTPP